jgi:hypothetical protein
MQSSFNANDELLGINGAIVGVETSTAERIPPAEGKIRGTLILTFSEAATQGGLKAPGGNINLSMALPTASSSSSRIRLLSDISGIDSNPIALVLLFPNPFQD